MRPAVRLQFQELVPALALAFAALACSGTVGGGPSPGGGGATSTGAAGNSGSGTAGSSQGGAGPGAGGSITTGTAGNGVQATCPTTAITPTPLRRLTQVRIRQHGQGPAERRPRPPANDLPADEVTDGFNNNAGVLTVSSLHAEKYVLVSEALAKAAVTEPRRADRELQHRRPGARTPARWTSRTPSGAARSGARSPPRTRELLMAAYTAGRTGGTYAEGHRGDDPRRAAVAELPLPAGDDGARQCRHAQLVPLSQYELATRLSFLIWAAGPDDALLDAAGRGELADRAAVATKARAMLADPKARVAITDFYNQWMGTSRLDITSKSATQFPRTRTPCATGWRGDARVRRVRAVDG